MTHGDIIPSVPTFRFNRRRELSVITTDIIWSVKMKWTQYCTLSNNDNHCNTVILFVCLLLLYKGSPLLSK